jgi:hypothetical protein
MTEAQLNRVRHEWSKIAGENIDIEYMSETTLYAYGSELACLRLGNAYKQTEAARVQYSINMETWVFSLDVYTRVIQCKS